MVPERRVSPRIMQALCKASIVLFCPCSFRGGELRKKERARWVGKHLTSKGRLPRMGG